MSSVIIIINSCIALIGLVFTGFMVYFMLKLNRNQEKTISQANVAAAKAEEVRTSLLKSSNSVEGLSTLTSDTHELVDEVRKTLLEVTVVALKKIYALTGSEDDKQAVAVAEKKLETSLEKIEKKAKAALDKLDVEEKKIRRQGS